MSLVKVPARDPSDTTFCQDDKNFSFVSKTMDFSPLVVYLSFSEMQPIFKLQSRLKLVQTERKTKFQRVKVEDILVFLY